VRPALARRLEGFGTTIFTEMTRLANEHGAVNLAQGFPDFDGPDFVKEAAVEAIRQGRGQYARMSGIPEIHAALAAKYRRDYGLDYAADTEFTVTSGATEAIFAAIQGTCEPGDEVVLFEPYYDSYRASVAMASAVPRFVTLRAPGWSFDPEELARAFTGKTRAILLNTPHNPTGKVFTREELEAVAALCREKDVLCITDEVYEHILYDGKHVPMATLPGMRERTITISSFGKTFSLTGWKIGWAAAPPDLTAAVRAAHQFITFATATPLQHAASAALAVGPEYYEGLASFYRRKRDTLVEELRRLGFLVESPAATYYVCADFRPLGFDDDVVFCRHLIENVGVAAIPPSAFYENTRHGKTYVRFAFCKKEETLKEAVRRLNTLSRRGGARGVSARLTSAPAAAEGRVSRSERPAGQGEGEPSVKIALLQMDIAWEDVPENHRRAAKMLAEAASGGARLAVLPEMFNTGFSMDSRRIAQPPGGPSETFLREQAAAHDIWILASLPEAGEPAPRNMALLVSPRGSMTRYAKIHPFSYAGEHERYTAGDRVVTAHVEGLRVTPFVCYDLRFPEPFRLAAAETDLFAVVANWPDERREHWRTLLRARAIENQAYVAGVNRVGDGGRLHYSGDSAVISPLGETLVEGDDREKVIFADVEPAAVQRLRSRFPALDDRRPDSYRR
jgi:N-succinyldiaminopimelate aminotransferase